MNRQRIGVIADTHGLMRPEALEALKGSELIVHAGDVGKPQVLERLRTIAPVVAVRGNIDKGEWAEALPPFDIVDIAGILIYVLHDLQDIDLDPQAAGFAVVISGHSHKPSIRHQDGVLLLNPGSAGPRRFTLPVSLASITVQAGKVAARILALPQGIA